jgi:putative membrane protein
MKTLKLGIIVLLGSILSMQACKDDDDDVEMMDNQTFVTEASSANLLEIQAGNLALQSATNAQVKAFAQHMATDHTQASAELLAVATSKNLSVSTQLNAKHQQQLGTLTGLTAAAFDKQFMALMVQSHQESVDLFERASQGVNDTDLRTFAANKLPVLKAHLTEATQLNAALQ